MNLVDVLKELDITSLAKQLISIPSYSFLENQELAVGSFIKSIFEKEGIETYFQPVADGRNNVIARIAGGAGRKLMLCGHIDTVPPYDMENAFEPSLKNGVLYGRGACDMKGAVAAMIAAMIAIKRMGTSLSGDLIFAGVVDEEEGGLGAEYLSEHGPFADSAIIGEPTGLDICLGHKGLEWIKVKFTGKKVHGGDQAHGINAIEMAARFVNRVYENYVPKLKTRTHPVLGSASINAGRIEGGDQPSTVAGECTLLLDRRLVPDETREQAYCELNELCESLSNEDKAFSASVSDMMAGLTNKPHHPYCVSPDEPIVKTLESALKARGYSGEKRAFNAWSDAGTLKSCTSCIPVVCGPGELTNAHSITDSVTEKQLFDAALIYARAAELYLKDDK